MALLNKLFTNRQTAQKFQDVSDRFFAFSQDQVRVVLFRECDFRGRKLLFDSTSVKKIALNAKSGDARSENDKFCEMSKGFGYTYKKAPQDFSQLAEMVFGSVAMSFRGTYFKIHTLQHPHRLMLSQVFSSPGATNLHARPSFSSPSLQHSRLDDSGVSSTSSMNRDASVRNTNSDTVIVCRLHHRTATLDVPFDGSTETSFPSLAGDSGYCGSHSFINSMRTTSPSWNSSIGKDPASTLSDSCGSCLQWISQTTFSLDSSGQSIPSAHSVQDVRPHHRSSKLGLAFILELTSDREEEMNIFLMEHIILLESMMWRARHVVEMAYINSRSFVSLMMEMVQDSVQYLVNLLSGSHLSLNFWLSLSGGCDNHNSISAFSGSNSMRAKLESKNSTHFTLSSGPFCSDGFLTDNNNSGEFRFSKFSHFLKTNPFNIKQNFAGEQRLSAEKFVHDFCELLLLVDIKKTNFFISTLLTAILTHHLGWVKTCLPSSDCSFWQTHSSNPLWGKLSDLYGTVGYPSKMAQTIITGSNHKDLISKILASLTYFIRCSEVDRQISTRINIEKENKQVEMLYHKCIPQENYKTYEDHLKDIIQSDRKFMSNYQSNNYQFDNKVLKNSIENGILMRRTTGLAKTSTCWGSLTAINDDSRISKQQAHSTVESFQLKQSLYCKTKSKNKLDVNHNGKESDTSSKDELIMLPKVPESTICSQDKLHQTSQNQFLDRRATGGSVVFVLGDNERLVGIRQEHPQTINLSPSERPLHLDITKIEKCIDFKDSDFTENDSSLVKPSTSWSQIYQKKAENLLIEHNKHSSNLKTLPRSQSEPPDDRKREISNNQSKYRYSGVKFNLQQHPQILSNYMKSKNLEISTLHFGDKHLKFEELSFLSDTITSKYPEINDDFDEEDALQTPSNASELEFTSDSFEFPSVGRNKENSEKSPITTVQEKECGTKSLPKMKVINLPMPETQFCKSLTTPICYTSSLMRASVDDYIPHMVMQGPTRVMNQNWISKLKTDLVLASQYFLERPVDEAVAVVANTDTWEVQLISSHTFLMDQNSSGVRIGMSQLVANMLDSLLQMFKLKVPPHFCLIHIEQTLQEFCIRSKALAKRLLTDEFCNMEQLTSSLHLEVNDIPLLLAVASTHSPEVTQKYGVSFQ